MPKLSFEEILEIMQIYSICGKLQYEPLRNLQRPFRSPHHSITVTAMLGGGRNPLPGEISLAHQGVLFLDELTELKSAVLEGLREPLEERKITINRNLMSVSYPCNFILVASMNPCPCGYYGTKQPCKCTQDQIKKYRRKISGPIMDRIDITIPIENVTYDKLTSTNKGETSTEIQKRVEKVRKIQKERYKKLQLQTNAQLETKHIEQYCTLSNKSQKILENAYQNLQLTTRAYMKILKVARTIADMDESQYIQEQHILEAISYRRKEE